ncbi:MAG: MoxR family ATPase [Ignavibacteriae bacterium]|nr:MoxR family ATPase [Ignavibacteriota bacterium]MCB9217228.1 MoxR family ATPase [Ignavibacteria bacterium]
MIDTNTTESVTVPTLNVQQIILKLQDAIDFVNRRVINREEIIEQIFCALLTGEHALIQSRTGVGKSLMVEQVFRMFDGARYFKVQASKEQQPDTYFGALDIEELRKGVLHHNTHGSLVESEFGFIDEIFDANDYTLRALLSLLNERELILGVQHVPSTVHTVIAATNYLRITDITEALLDRFAYQSVAWPDKDPYVQYRISQQYLRHGGKAVAPPFTIDYRNLAEVRSICHGTSELVSIDISSDVAYFANLVIRYYEELRNRSLEQQGESIGAGDYYISPRKQMKAFDLLRAIAFMHGRTSVQYDDVSRLYILFTTVGVDEERNLWNKACSALSHQFTATNAFDQLATLLQFKDLLTHLKQHPEDLGKPLGQIEGIPVKRSVLEWARETLGFADANFENNRRLITEYLNQYQPATQEIRELKESLQRDARILFGGSDAGGRPLL